MAKMLSGRKRGCDQEGEELLEELGQKVGQNSKKKKKATQKCSVCGEDSLYCYYGVQGCEGCKQFFRRVVVKQKAFFCWKVRRCDVANGERCRGCRLDKCLSVGMDPTMVNVSENTANLAAFIAKLEERRIKATSQEARMQQKSELPIAEGEHMGQSPPLLVVVKRETIQPETRQIEPSDILRQQRSSFAEVEQQSQCFVGAPALIQCAPSSQQMADFQMLYSLLSTEQQLKRIWDSPRELPSGYLQQFSSVEDILRSKNNLLGRAHEFPGAPTRCWNKAEFVDQSEKLAFFFPDNINLIIKDRVLCIELAKTMPFFQRLAIKDQMALLRGVALPIQMFLHAFYSYKMNASTFTQSDGMTLVSVFEAKRWESNQKVHQLGRSCTCNTVEAFRRAGIGIEEFVILMAIVFASTTSSELSASARQILYEEAVNYSQALLRLLQQRYGQCVGAKRYAVAIQLVNAAFHYENRAQMLTTYLEVFFTRVGPERHYPPAIMDLLRSK